MRVHRVIVEPSGTIEYRITDPKDYLDPHKKHVAGPEDLDAVVAKLRSELEADIRHCKIA